ncbi:MAG: VOC family protein [Balneolaceae bacterium]|nr:VOC family protein [Balneolaceae bacterium]
MKNAISWFEIPAADIDRAKSFYEAIFDFEMQSLDISEEVKMALFPAEENTVGGALVYNEEWYHPSNSAGSLVYLNANPDLQDVLDRVEEQGGSIEIEKRIITEDYGHMAIIEDSEGNRIALHSDN